MHYLLSLNIIQVAPDHEKRHLQGWTIESFVTFLIKLSLYEKASMLLLFRYQGSNTMTPPSLGESLEVGATAIWLLSTSKVLLLAFAKYGYGKGLRGK